MARLKLTFTQYQNDGTTETGKEEVLLSAANTGRLAAAIESMTADDLANPVTGTPLQKFRKLTINWWRERVREVEGRVIDETKRAEAEAEKAAITDVDA